MEHSRSGDTVFLRKVFSIVIGKKWKSMKEATQLTKSMPAEMEVERESLRGKSVKLTEGMVLAKARSSDLENVKKLNCWYVPLFFIT